jgi:transaldolase
MAESRLHRLSELGQSVWLDFVSRELLETGGLQRLLDDDAVVGVTSNPTIFQGAIASGDRYDEQIRSCLEELDDAKEIFLRLAVQDIQAACDVLRPVWDGGGGRDGYVSIEVDPTLAYDRDATIEEAVRLWDWVDRPNVLVKIPATEPGLEAIEECIARGVSINVTLIFSLARHREVMGAYLRGLERFLAGGGDASRIASVASFFVSRVDTEADKRLEAIGTPEALALRGKLAVANAKLAYRAAQEVFAGGRWDALAARGATEQRPLWASTSTKNPEYRDVVYVEELIGPGTVNTMPLDTIRAFQDHGEVAPTLTEGVDEAERLLEQLAALGVDYDDVTRVLEEEGVKKFADSFGQMLDGVGAKRSELAAV